MAGEAVSRGELGHHQAASAEVANKAAKNRVGDAGHGCEDSGGTDFDSAERHRRGNASTGRGGARGRVVEEFGHLEIVATSHQELATRSGCSSMVFRHWHSRRRRYDFGMTLRLLAIAALIGIAV